MISPDFTNLPMWLITALILILVFVVGYFLKEAHKQLKGISITLNKIEVDLATQITNMSNMRSDHEKLVGEHTELRRRVDKIYEDIIPQMKYPVK